MTRHPKQFVWFDLRTEDIEESLSFYSDVVDWETTSRETCGDSYDMWRVGKRLFGGAVELPERNDRTPPDPHWLGYVAVADLEEKLERLEALGGERVGDPVAIGTAGRYAVARDPMGATFALRESRPGAHRRHRARPDRLGGVSWYELTTTDVDAAWQFYSHLLGWQAGARLDVGIGIPYQLFGWGGVNRGSIFRQIPDTRHSPTWLYHFAVPDLDAALERLASHDGSVVAGPMVGPNGDRVVHCRDCHGAMFGLHLPSEWIGRPPRRDAETTEVGASAPSSRRRRATGRSAG